MPAASTPSSAELVALLTKAVGTISALAVMADKQHRIGAYTAEYVAAINAFDNTRRLSQAERVDLRTVPSSMETTAAGWGRS